MKRRDALRAGAGVLGATALTGCLQTLGFEMQSAWRDPPLPSDRPSAVYYPAIVEEMGMYGTTNVDGVTFALTYSYPHRFWTVTGEHAEKVVVDDEDSVHLMASIWDTETKTVLPVDMGLEVLQDGEVVVQRSPWPMLSQSMGFHYGDNIELPTEATYTARLRVGPLPARRTGAFENRFGEAKTAEIQFEFDTNRTYNLAIRRLGQKAGKRGAVEPMMGNMPIATAPPRSKIPGQLIGETTSGDATFVVSSLTDAPRFGDGTYLAVSPRTPYNRIILPLMSLSATVVRNGTTIWDRRLQQTLDPELGYHYGSIVDELAAGDTLTITVDAPPQVSRHDGYETALIEMPPMEIAV